MRIEAAFLLLLITVTAACTDVAKVQTTSGGGGGRLAITDIEANNTTVQVSAGLSPAVKEENAIYFGIKSNGTILPNTTTRSEPNKTNDASVITASTSYDTKLLPSLCNATFLVAGLQQSKGESTIGENPNRLDTVPSPICSATEDNSTPTSSISGAPVAGGDPFPPGENVTNPRGPIAAVS